ncbi:MAG: hypothetical protein RJA99_217 [Pseudomonadota bacterium]|jgi:hypothetical protein
MDPLHLTLGDHAARLLEVATRRHGLPGDVRAIPDDLSHGPLDDGIARLEWMRRCYQGCFAWSPPVDDAFEPWRTAAASLQVRPRPLVLWGGATAAEAVFVAMACARLGALGVPLRRVQPPSDGPRVAIGAFDAAELAASFSHAATELDAAACAAQAALFRALCADPSPRRVLRDGVPVGAPAEVFDDVLLDAGDETWQSAAKVVGTAMGRCDPRQSISDVWLGWRLQAAIDAGRLEADGPRTGLRDFSVRLARGGALDAPAAAPAPSEG